MNIRNGDTDLIDELFAGIKGRNQLFAAEEAGVRFCCLVARAALINLFG